MGHRNAVRYLEYLYKIAPFLSARIGDAIFPSIIGLETKGGRNHLTLREFRPVSRQILMLSEAPSRYKESHSYDNSGKDQAR
jgi:hypothetical protein